MRTHAHMQHILSYLSPHLGDIALWRSRDDFARLASSGVNEFCRWVQVDTLHHANGSMLTGPEFQHEDWECACCSFPRQLHAKKALINHLKAAATPRRQCTEGRAKKDKADHQHV